MGKHQTEEAEIARRSAWPCNRRFPPCQREAHGATALRKSLSSPSILRWSRSRRYGHLSPPAIPWSWTWSPASPSISWALWCRGNASETIETWKPWLFPGSWIHGPYSLGESGRIVNPDPVNDKSLLEYFFLKIYWSNS